MGNTPDFVKLAESYGINAVRVEELDKTQEVLSKALKDNEAILVDITVEKDQFIPMFPQGGGINDLLGEYKYESDVELDYLDDEELSKDSQSVEGGQ